MENAILLTGVIRGTTITLDEPTSLPDGARVTLQLVGTPAVPRDKGEEPDQTLETIYRMRHTGRSIQQP